MFPCSHTLSECFRTVIFRNFVSLLPKIGQCSLVPQNPWETLNIVVQSSNIVPQFVHDLIAGYQSHVINTLIGIACISNSSLSSPRGLSTLTRTTFTENGCILQFKEPRCNKICTELLSYSVHIGERWFRFFFAFFFLWVCGTRLRFTSLHKKDLSNILLIQTLWQFE